MHDFNLLTPTRIIKSKRKSISLIIKNNGEFVVRAPIRASDVEINNFIIKKSNWVILKRKERINSKFKPLTVNDNETITILGKQYTIKLNNKNKVKIVYDDIIVPLNNSKEKLIHFLKLKLKIYITEFLQYIANKTDFKYESFNINSAKTRWGSCSFKNHLHFTYKLALAPLDVINYIVIHELCHTKEKNHSKQFWDLVLYHCPNYKNCEKWLKENINVIELI